VEYVHKQLLEKRKEGMAILLATEDLDELFLLADRIAVIFQGNIMGILDSAKATREQIGLLMAGCQES
jgi:simple sugar transport system ATP-binding protein